MFTYDVGHQDLAMYPSFHRIFLCQLHAQKLCHCHTQYGSTDGPVVMCVLKEIPIITFSLWCTRLLASLACRYGQKVTLIKKNESVICLRKVVNRK